MECDRLQRLVKRWYLQVQAEEMGPARMVDFMNNHLSECLTCLADPAVGFEVKRITELVLPQDKIPKAVRRESESQDDIDDSDYGGTAEESLGVDENEGDDDLDDSDSDDDGDEDSDDDLEEIEI